MSWKIQLFEIIVYFIKFGIGSVIGYAVLKEAIIAALKEYDLSNEQNLEKS
ncbi:hypothetical protein [Rhodohalobacter sulfatireducens]|uniref:Chromate transporter n=1 Tax=Rhodohalobacter sulfatireducens TaxID=2911366 RepID=A0ABS9K8E8_9BACT|nr:hypothetical protein [Rhodohalobacter sulfatireducens]MCG2587127.1 hypothetical protein [Rhodohalobacter sulfatireducens]MDR9367220.1 hypothetical protein [Balneolaceae bacterium]MDR9409430.1 hypothetical protein [Balneolaceae bacterium]